MAAGRDTAADSRFGVTELDELPDDLRERVGVIAEKSGFVPNIFRALGRRPRELRAFLDYHDALMESSEGLSKAERELVVVATSGANHCTYCVVAHGAILRIRSRDPQLPELFGEADLARARAAGLTEDEIWDVGAITALFAASNRLAHLTALRPNPEFYLMGREPRR